MVWASSTRIGCGKSRSRTGKTIVVAHYYPRDHSHMTWGKGYPNKRAMALWISVQC